MAKAAQDPWLTDRLKADVGLSRAEQRIEAAVRAAMAQWLDAARVLVLGGRADLNNPVDNIAASNPMVASGSAGGRRLRHTRRSETGYNISVLVADADFVLDLDAVQASFGAWQEALQTHVEPAISEAFAEGFGGSARSATISPLPYQEAHIREVHSRLKMWPEGAWEDMRPELQQIISRSGTTEEAAQQVAGILDINAPTRRLREQIASVDADIVASTDPAATRALRAQRKQLWEQHDRSLGEWQHLARRIARTEVQGAVEGGQLASAEATAHATGQPMFKRWLATSDSRCRRSHAIADGQIVPIADRFHVGRARLKHPAEPGGPAHEVIQCRCTMQILSQHEVDSALDSEWGRRGVQPMSLRMGPDDQSAVDMADGLLKREQAGEVVDWPQREELPAAPSKRKPRAYEEFKGKSLDDLGQSAADAIEAEDWDTLDRVMAEEQRRVTANAVAQARRSAQREAKEAAQMQRYEDLLEEGVDDETAVSDAFGISIEKQRRVNAIAHLRGLGYQGDSLDTLVRAWHQDEAYQAWLSAENATNGQLLAPKHREALTVDPRSLWTSSEATALKYASDELKAWWDTNGRVTVAELKAQLLDPAELARIMSGRRDFLQ